MHDPDELSQDDKFDKIVSIGGASAIPSFLGERYQRPGLLRPSAIVAWYFAVASFIIAPLAVVAIPLGIRAGRRGNPWGWGAAAASIALAAISFAAFW